MSSIHTINGYLDHLTTGPHQNQIELCWNHWWLSEFNQSNSIKGPGLPWGPIWCSPGHHTIRRVFNNKQRQTFHETNMATEIYLFQHDIRNEFDFMADFLAISYLRVPKYNWVISSNTPYWHIQTPRIRPNIKVCCPRPLLPCTHR